MIGTLLERLKANAIERNEKRKGRKKITVHDLKGNTLDIPRDLFHDLAMAEIIDEAAAQEKHLVWHDELVWVLGTEHMREIIRIAQMYDDVEMGLIGVAVATHFDSNEED